MKKDNSKNRDFIYIKRIKQHAELAVHTFSETPIDTFLNNEAVERKAILFDLFQVGELVQSLSHDLQLSLEDKGFSGVINVRNHIVHGYDSINNDTIINSLSTELIPFVKTLEINAMKLYDRNILTLLGTRKTVMVDKPINKNQPINVGHINEITSPNGEYQQVIVLDMDEPIFQHDCLISGFIKINNDPNYILIGTVFNTKISEEHAKEIIEAKTTVSDYSLVLK